MKRKGMENPDYTGMPTGNPEDEPQEERKWYDKVADMDLKIPHVTRPKGKGSRIDFYVESRFPDMALEIKEGDKRRYKNTNDVHRAAHYIGMYIIRALQANKKRDVLGEVFKELEWAHQRNSIRTTLRKEFMVHFESFCTGIISEPELESVIRTMLDAIQKPNIKQWLEVEIKTIMDSTGPYDSVYAKIRKQKSRAGKKEAESMGLHVIKGEE